MKASLVAYDFRELYQKVRAKNNKIWICQRLPKKVVTQMRVAQNFRG
jgi:hypothetical protein